MCGNCCSGKKGSVVFSEEEAESMANKLNINVKEFLQSYARKGRSGSWEEGSCFPISLLMVLVAAARVLKHVARKMPGKAVCMLYESRPLQCRTWPFWIENVVDQEAWEEAGQEFVFSFQSVTNFDKNSESRCPGLGKGRLHDAKTIFESSQTTSDDFPFK
ncbi:hypothetical protein GUITHDRAFT_109948 [Guillardia theta CCMP2712]|uniref:YkgJ family cysteine cluster protein n=1 Tax=Guillardia theta (strain CCMP2712) TaxID=905079 RepID=L1J6L9_GUITC|nr:hypothetical protein GUITHDRAFT_109948 [Guillardia theta CCMP2712]EKX44166.1 hypothetical protein GUITHDRAFT_109948 [Guillardia theta CCMP2712]|eukprot:XP_005831146.1 hypothetical protein GUITHDRAFT_109948 [Guillardia theta CCMP2712]